MYSRYSKLTGLTDHSLIKSTD